VKTTNAKAAALDKANPPTRRPRDHARRTSNHHKADKGHFTACADLVRCRRCRKPLYTALSQFLGVGPICRRHLLDAELSNALHSCADDLAVV
jgi:hypothetical protein